MDDMDVLKQRLQEIVHTAYQLEADLLVLRQQIEKEKGNNRCKVCGGALRRTRYAYRCIQENGLCGELLVSPQKFQAHFNQTEYDLDSGEYRHLPRIFVPLVHYYFKGNERVDMDTYFDLLYPDGREGCSRA